MPIKYFPPVSTNTFWGDINGELSNQVDLVSALSGKSPINHNHDANYSLIDHNHDNSYSAKNHNHNNLYEPIGIAANLADEDKRIKGIYLDLPYLYNHNCKLIDDCESGWSARAGGGSVADDTTNYKVGSKGVQITGSAHAHGGIKTVSLDLTKFGDGSAATNNDYILYVLYISSAQLANLSGANGIRFELSDGTNTCIINFAYANLSAGYNYIQFRINTMSDYNKVNLAAITIVSSYISGTPAAATTWTIDAIRMVRKDPSFNNPNQFQISINGTQTALFSISSGNCFLGYDGESLVLKALTATKLTGATFTELYFKAVGKAAATGMVTIGFNNANPNSIGLSSDKLVLTSDGATSMNSVAVDVGDVVMLQGQILGKSMNGIISKTGTSACLGRTATADLSGAALFIQLAEMAHLTSFKASNSRLLIGD